MFSRKIAYLGLTFLAIFIVVSITAHVFAQDAEDPWTEPRNLSRTGTAASPHLIIEEDGVVDVIWQDVASNTFLYTRSQGNEWLEPAVSEPPFGTRRFFPDLDEDIATPLFDPHLVADANRIHAFWLDEERTLRYSSVVPSEFASFGAWLPRRSLAGSVMALAVGVDDGGWLHLIYLGLEGADGSPAGIYYRRTEDGGESWTEPILLYASPYLRAVPADQSNLQMATNGSGESATVFAAWDNRALDSVFVTRSTDGGQTWDDPITVDQRQVEDQTAAVGPSGIRVHLAGPEVHLIWRAGHDLSDCDQYHQLSTDGGDSWLPPQAMMIGAQGCPDNNWLIGDSSGLTLLLSSFQGQPMLMAWDGERWSEPQSQATLTSFTNPATYRVVEFGCLQPALLDETKLAVAGCNTGLAPDIWITSRAVGDEETWFPPESIWSPPITIASDASRPQEPVMVADADSRLHAFWSQSSADNTAIRYALLADDRWTRPFSLANSSSSDAGPPAVALDADDQLLVVWSGGPGEIYFSQAGSDQAFVSANWSAPMALPVPRQGAINPSIAIDRSGTIYVAYAIPLNEMRGIYLTQSADNGHTWTSPVQVFDAVAAGWERIGRPQLALSPEGEIHLVWSRQTLSGPDEGKTQALFYARSDDGGATFSNAELAVEGLLGWTQILATAEGAIHRFWQVDNGSASFVQHERSLDGGRSWEAPIIVSNAFGPAAVTADGGGRLHFIQASDASGTYRLWDGDAWQLQEGLEGLDEQVAGGAASISALFSPEGRLSVLFSGQAAGVESDETQYNLFYSDRPVELPVAVPTPLPTPTSTPLPTATATATPAPIPTPTADLSNISRQGGALPFNFIDTSDTMVGTIVSLLPAALLLLLVFGVAVLVIRRRQS